MSSGKRAVVLLELPLTQIAAFARLHSRPHFTRKDPDRLTKRLIRQLEALGHDVTLQPREVAA
jgi:hypothetical protein